MKRDLSALYIKYSRPFFIFVVLLLHTAAIYGINFRNHVEEETEETAEATVFKLVDIMEALPPPPEPAPVKEKIVEVRDQPAASEKIVETQDKVQVIKEEINYLPQHKISAVPVIPGNEVLSRIVYPPMALKQGIEAVVYLELLIDSKGQIRNINVLKDPGYGFAQAAIAALDGISCIPASSNGKNCAVRYRYPVRFTLRK
ncbi:energy transducer TonB [Treponema sp.]|uniref:energy transducer TonB n=1 Tax=Treponema sp. TaxID=166 RepID=UPI0025DEC033|nr:energy transducer TonB [Treponema sp.]MCR5217981.1 energy transducer TonB [Treponema sp.]